ncbi:hypothetical protein I7I50_08761 [Histoplasma capsulatum G186AR]|uniref:Uncharacterized protein n=1 Tax=Ajellomyces capsulatus TaxID=5037 RepID=A0A8H7YRH0_AJECA|nr:hypothetical protein I7I52_06275 [Histoplasma capsulatum]QSS73839.1 hypothetical protein I7I50_08761 [Histoplasma capsulatum G186AR]
MKLLLSTIVGFHIFFNGIAWKTSISEFLTKLNPHMDGFLHIDEHGILRHYDGDGEVLDYARLEPTELTAFAQERYTGGTLDDLLAVWRDADSSLVEDEMIWNPPEDHFALMNSEDALPDTPETLKSGDTNLLEASATLSCRDFFCRQNSHCSLAWGTPSPCRLCLGVSNHSGGYCNP